MGRHVVSFLKVWREGQTHTTNLDERQKKKKGNEIYEILLRFVLFCFVLFGGGGYIAWYIPITLTSLLFFYFNFSQVSKKGEGANT